MKNHAGDLSEDLQTVPLSRAILAQSIRRPKSLSPDHKLCFAACYGEKSAVAIRDQWAFRFPVTTLSRERYAELVARTEGITFND